MESLDEFFHGTMSFIICAKCNFNNCYVFLSLLVIMLFCIKLSILIYSFVSIIIFCHLFLIMYNFR